jgi:FkbM family methyltransferase
MTKRWLFRRVLKPVFSTTIYREGTTRSILWGPCRGLKYRIFPQYGMSPLYGGWERDVQRIMVRHLHKGFIAYDIGANFGIHTLLMARLVGKTGHVYAFEPMPTIHRWLQDNVMMNAFANVTCLNFAISDYNGYSNFQIGHHGGAGHLVTGLDEAQQVITVPTRTLDELIFAENQPPPAFVKVDVEGAESKVLAGASQAIETFHPILLIELHTPEQDLLVGEFLSKYNYTAFHTNDGSKVQDLTKGWPHKNGLWGQIVAYPAHM